MSHTGESKLYPDHNHPMLLAERTNTYPESVGNYHNDIVAALKRAGKPWDEPANGRYLTESLFYCNGRHDVNTGLDFVRQCNNGDSDYCHMPKDAFGLWVGDDGVCHNA